MNRIKISPLATRPLEENNSAKSESSNLKLQCSDDLFEQSETALPLGINDSFSISDSCLFVPLHYEANYKYPLVVWLHNNGDDPQQLHRVMPKLSLQNFVAIAPHAALGDEHTGFYWEQDAASINFAADAVIGAIDYAMARTNICTDRIYIAGFGAAGTMAYRVALTHPDIFGGVASINGPLPEGETPLGRWGSSRNIEVFWAHYRKSSEFDQEILCRQLKLLHVAGFSVTLRQYPGGDELAAPALADLNRWIMQMNDSTIS